MSMQLLSANDMAKLGCGECDGCSACCRGMGQSILVDPYDIFQLQKVTGQNFAGLMQEKLALGVENGLILPSLRMQPETDACGFLDVRGRCSIHSHRPGLCRLFPLGRLYEEGTFSYFLQLYIQGFLSLVLLQLPIHRHIPLQLFHTIQQADFLKVQM